jgi:hypothetical protein
VTWQGRRAIYNGNFPFSFCQVYGCDKWEFFYVFYDDLASNQDMLYGSGYFFYKQILNYKKYKVYSTLTINSKRDKSHQKQFKRLLHQSEKTTLTFVFSLSISQNQAIYLICSTNDETLTKVHGIWYCYAYAINSK